jgi:hypothetical protein
MYYKTPPPPMLILYASELAAAAGMHRYQSRLDAMQQVLWRLRAPKTEEERTQFKNALEVDSKCSKLINNAFGHLPPARTAREVLERTQDIRRLASATFPDHEEVVANAAVSSLFTDFGTAMEDSALSMAGSRHLEDWILRREPRFFKVQCGEGWGVGGRVDALARHKHDEDREVVVEIKNRVRRLFRSVPVYENVQLHAYMHMFDLPQACLVEVFGDESLAHWVDFDASFWKGCLPALQSFVDELKTSY